VHRSSDWIVDITEAIDDFAEDWRSFVTPDNATPFQHYEVMRIVFSRLISGGGKPKIARVRDPNGRLVALFPMHILRQHGLTWLRTDVRPLDYCAPIFAPGLTQNQTSDIIRAVLAAVPEADLLYVNRIPETFSGAPSPLITMPNTARLRLSSWHLTLKGQTLDDLVARQSKQFKSQLRTRTKKFMAKHDRKIDVAFGKDVSAADFEAFSDLRQSSFDVKERSNILSDPQWGPLYATLLAEGIECRAWLATLRADGEILAALYGFQTGLRVQIILPASKMGDWQYYRLGLQLFQETITYFHKQGAEIYDLSIGDSPYKKRIGGAEEGLYDALFPRSFAGYVYYILWRLKVKLRARMRPID